MPGHDHMAGSGGLRGFRLRIPSGKYCCWQQQARNHWDASRSVKFLGKCIHKLRRLNETPYSTNGVHFRHNLDTGRFRALTAPWLGKKAAATRSSTGGNDSLRLCRAPRLFCSRFGGGVLRVLFFRQGWKLHVYQALLEFVLKHRFFRQICLRGGLTGQFP